MKFKYVYIFVSLILATTGFYIGVFYEDIQNMWILLIGSFLFDFKGELEEIKERLPKNPIK